MELNYTPNVIPAPYQDEWSYCAAVGKAVCGPVLEQHYSTFVSTADIDKVASYGINTLRIPVSASLLVCSTSVYASSPSEADSGHRALAAYAAFMDVPGSQLYHGNQVTYLRNIAEYAVQKYNMHIVVRPLALAVVPPCLARRP